MATIGIDEILSYEPADKRSRMVPSNASENGHGAKLGDTATAGLDPAQLLAAVEADQSGISEALDEGVVRRLLQAFDKKLLKNTEMRVKFAEDPSKFMDSELELNMAIQELHSIATRPDLYPLLMEDTQGAQSLLQLLGHENTDIVTAVCALLQELTDVDTLTEDAEGADALIDRLIQGKLLALLVVCLEKFNELDSDEADGVHNVLSVIENLFEYRPELSERAHECNLLIWLLKRVRAKAVFDANKLYASEILGIILQQSEEARKLVGVKDGIDVLLQSLASFKRRDPESVDEREFMENLFNCLCAALMHAQNRDRFLNGEGLQLMNLMLRERKDSRNGALKVLSYATNGKEGASNCDKLVELLGLRTLFPLFMKTPSKQTRKGGHTSQEHEEHVCAVLSSLLRNCNQANRTRVISKFTEQDHAKVDRLVELHMKYSQRVSKFTPAVPEGETPLTEEEAYVQRLDAGLFTLQLVDLILADVCVNGEASVAQNARKLLNMKGSSVKSVKSILEEYVENLGEDAKHEMKRVETLITSL